jgi:hypothetical protein
VAASRSLVHCPGALFKVISFRGPPHQHDEYAVSQRNEPVGGMRIDFSGTERHNRDLPLVSADAKLIRPKAGISLPPGCMTLKTSPLNDCHSRFSSTYKQVKLPACEAIRSIDSDSGRSCDSSFGIRETCDDDRISILFRRSSLKRYLSECQSSLSRSYASTISRIKLLSPG